MTIKIYRNIVLLTTVAAVFPTMALAQTATPRSDEIPDIIVTAQKREQSVNSVGMTINAMTETQLKSAGVSSVADLVKVEPSFAVTRNGQGEPIYTIRGIGFNTNATGAPPAVSVYVDETPLSFAALSKGAALDVERVEILKGPQGTLFGQNSTGGAINYIAAKPTDALRFGVDATYARFNAVKLDAFVSGPITDTLKARLAVSTEQGGAWQRSVSRDDTLGNKNNRYARLLLDWTPDPKLKISANVNGWTNKSDNQAAALFAVALQKPAFAAQVPLTINEPINLTDPRAADWPNVLRPKNDETYYQGALRIEYHASDALNVTYVGSYANYKANDVLTYTGTPSPFYADERVHLHTFSNELRASGNIFDNKLAWLVGGTYSKDVDKEDVLSQVIGVTTAYSLVGLKRVDGTTVTTPFNTSEPVMTQNVETKAIFGNLEYHITRNLSIHGGARYTKMTNDHTGCSIAADAASADSYTAFENRIRGGVGVIPVKVGECITFDPATNYPALIVNSLSEHNVSWRFGIDWKPIEKSLIYATVSKGYKAGSFPIVGAVSTVALNAARQESVLAYEAGFKTRLAHDRVQIDGAVFYYDYRNKQQQLRTPDPVFGLLNVLLNVPKSRELGAEFTLKVIPVTGITLSGAVTYLDTKVVGDFFNYSQFALSAATTTNFNGDPLPNTPKWSYTAGARYDFALSSIYSGYVGGEVRGSSSTQSFFGSYTALAAGFPSMINAPYALINLRAGATSNDGHWRFEAFGENVTNKYYTTQSNRVDTVARFVGMPATYGIRVGYRY